MRRFTLSAPQRPMFESAPYRQSPARRLWVHGPIQPMEQDGRVTRILKWLKGDR